MRRLQGTSYRTQTPRGYSHPPKVTNKEIGSTVQVFWGFDPHLLEVTTAELFNSINVYLPSHLYIPSKKKGKPKERTAGRFSNMCCELL